MMAQGRRISVRGFTRGLALPALAAAALLLGGCGLFGAAGESPTPMPTRTPLPTFTPTAPAPAAAPAATVAPVPAALPPAGTEPLTLTDALRAAEPVTATALVTDAASAVAPTAAPAEALLTISSDFVNVRSGPGTEFDLVGTVGSGESYSLIARDAAGDWWQICCLAGQNGWVFGELVTVQNAEGVGVAAEAAAAPATAADPGAVAAVPATTEAAPAPTEEPAPRETAPVEPPPAEGAPAPAPPAELAAYDPGASSAGNFDPNAQYQIVHFKVRGLDENNGGIRDSGAQHHIFLTVLDQNGNGVDGAVVRDLVGDEKSDVTTGNKGPGQTEITMYYDPFKLAVVSDPSGPVTSQVSNQMGLIFPHLPDIAGKLGDASYEYGVCPTLDTKCGWPLSDYNYVHFSYEVTFQKVK